MKFNLRNISINIFVFLILTLSLFSSVVFAEAVKDNDSKIEIAKRVSVSVRIPLIQQVNVTEIKEVNYDLLMDNYNGSREIVIEDALSVELFSNADWFLNLNNRNLNSTIMIKKSSQSNSEWQNLNTTTAKYKGKFGVHKITFDLKFILDKSSIAAVENLELDLRHSIVSTVY